MIGGVACSEIAGSWVMSDFEWGWVLLSQVRWLDPSAGASDNSKSDFQSIHEGHFWTFANHVEKCTIRYLELRLQNSNLTSNPKLQRLKHWHLTRAYQPSGTPKPNSFPGNSSSPVSIICLLWALKEMKHKDTTKQRFWAALDTKVEAKPPGDVSECVSDWTRCTCLPRPSQSSVDGCSKPLLPCPSMSLIS